MNPPHQNLLLSLLPAEAAAPLMASMDRQVLAVNTGLTRDHEPMSSVYFPLTAVISLVKIFADGSAVEVAAVGNEGMIGNTILIGGNVLPESTVTQVPGEALVLPAARFRDAIHPDGPLRSVVTRYTLALRHQIAQSVGCNARHPIEQRCARWLLMTHDRVGRDAFPLTHELLAIMIGVRRSSVTLAAQTLQANGLIAYHRGQITILDRPGLEAAACECYGAARKEFERVMFGE
jgi:CRP-like cAMP-binding protein